MYLIIEENPNCKPDERVFSESGQPRAVSMLNVEIPAGSSDWCEVIGVDENGRFKPALAVQVEDSGAGNAWLIYGGEWGLRFRAPGSQKEWALADSTQWGEAFKVFDISGEGIRFKQKDN